MQPQYQQPYAPQPYPAQQPPMPQYPAQQPYAAPPAPVYPQQYAPPAPAAPLPTGTLDTFYSQPSGGGGPSFKFMDANRQPQIGKSYEGFVARPVTDADVRAQTDQVGNPQTYRDGRPKFVMVVPMQVQPSQEFPDGQAGWWVKGQARDELARAMAEAGAPAGPPEHGAWIRVTLVSIRPIPNRNPAYQYRVEYRSPANAPAAPVASPASVGQPAQFPNPPHGSTGQFTGGQAPQPQQFVPVQQPTMTPYEVSAVMYPPPGNGPAHVVQPAPPAPIAAPVAQQPAPVGQPLSPVQVAQAAAPAAADPRLAGLSPEQQALFASLTGGTAAPAQPAS